MPATALTLLQTMAAEIAAALIDARLHAAVTHAAHMRRALALARRTAGPAGTVIVTGSLFLVGEVKKISLPA